MQRRDFSRSLVAAGTTALAAAGGLTLTPALAQRVGPKEGTEFVRVNPMAPVESPASQVEVVEFFAYSCIHCFNFEPIFDEWLKKQPANVNVRQEYTVRAITGARRASAGRRLRRYAGPRAPRLET